MTSPPRRIRIVGVSGSGKSRLAQRVAEILALPRLELDAVFWDADWTYRSLEEAHRVVDDFVAAHPDGWVIEGNWTSRLDGRLDAGGDDPPDLVVWLDPPRTTVLRRIVLRTLRRGLTREELWHGNRERPSTWVSLDPDRNIVVWSWTQHPLVRARMLERMSTGEPIVRLRDQRAVDAWLAGLAAR